MAIFPYDQRLGNNPWRCAWPSFCFALATASIPTFSARQYANAEKHICLLAHLRGHIWICSWRKLCFSIFISASGTAQLRQWQTARNRVSNPRRKAGAREAALNNYTEGVMAFTGVLAFATIALGILTAGLYKAGQDQLRHAEQTAHRELRAYVGVEPRGVKRIVGEDHLLGHIAIRNFGKIPAKNISMFAVTDYYPDPTKMVFKVGQLYKSKTTLQPRAEMIFGAASTVDIDSIVVTDDADADYVGYIFVYGKITYTDEFETDGWTEFCHRYPCIRMEGDSRISRKHARYHEIEGNAAA